MSGFQDIFSHPFLNALGWALLHFIWQGAVVTLVLASLLFVLNGYAARIRYGLALSAMLFMPILFAITTWQIWYSLQEIVVYSQPVSPAVPSASSLATPPQVELNESAAAGAEMVSQPATYLSTSAIGESPRFSVRLKQWVVNRIESLLPWVVSLWLVGVLALSARLTIGLRQAQRLKSEGVVPVTARLYTHLVNLCGRMRISRPVQLLESALIQVPTAIGWLRPVVLLPASALTGLTPSQLETILAHELAHIRRHDYLLNLIQTVVEILFFYHPLVWWIGNRVRVERENCCDDLAVAVCGAPLTYARALTKMEQLRSVPSQLAMAVNNGSLLHRIRRLVNPLSSQSDRLVRQLGGALAIAAVFAVGITAHFFDISIAVADRPMEVIEGTAAEGTLATLSQALRDESDQTRFQAARALRQIKNEEAIPVLIETLRDESRHVRLEAAYALGYITEKAPVLALAEALGDGSGQMRLQAAYALSYIPDKATVPTLINALDSESEAMRLHAAYALSYVPNKAAVPSLIESLKDDSEQVRLQAAYALSYILDVAAVPALIARLNDESERVRLQAAYALGRVPDKRSAPALIVMLRDESEQVRQQAAHALGRIGDRMAVPALIATLGDRFEQVRLQVAYALGRMPDRSAIPALTSALKDESERVREQAAYALERIGDKVAIPRPTSTLQEDSEQVRRQAVKVLDEIR